MRVVNKSIINKAISKFLVCGSSVILVIYKNAKIHLSSPIVQTQHQL